MYYNLKIRTNVASKYSTNYYLNVVFTKKQYNNHRF